MDHCQIVEDMESEVEDIMDLDFCKVERGFQCKSWVELVRERDRRLREEAEGRARYRVEARFFVAPNW
jgi:hypothetical protein